MKRRRGGGCKYRLGIGVSFVLLYYRMLSFVSCFIVEHCGLDYSNEGFHEQNVLDLSDWLSWIITRGSP